MNKVRSVVWSAFFGFCTALVGCGGAYYEAGYPSGGGYGASSDSESSNASDPSQAIVEEVARQSRQIQEQSQANVDQFRQLTSQPEPANGGVARQSHCHGPPGVWCASAAR
jgi:hypothetical protein